MEGEEEEEDYISEAFLQELKDVRPGLLTRAQKRKRKCDERHEKSKSLPKHKMIKIAESEARQQALSMPMSSSSKGYSLMQKMGYKDGTGLGKSGGISYKCFTFTVLQIYIHLTAGEGRTSLIPLVLKEGKLIVI